MNKQRWCVVSLCMNTLSPLFVPDGLSVVDVKRTGTFLCVLLHICISNLLGTHHPQTSGLETITVSVFLFLPSVPGSGSFCRPHPGPLTGCSNLGGGGLG